MFNIRRFALFVLVALMITEASAQTGGSGRASGPALPVTRCDPDANSCGSGARTIRMPALGAAGRATVLSPTLRSTELALDPAEYRVPVPGCTRIEPGVLGCGSVHDYQHCRTLMIAGITHACQINVAFAGGDIEPRAAVRGHYDVKLNSNAKVRVTLGDRGHGQIRGKAEAVVAFDPPSELKDQAWCLQRDRLLYYPTGPQGGMSDIGETDDCAKPIEFSFEPHEDDLLRAYDLCETFDAWGEELEDSIEILAASMFELRSATPAFVASHPGGSAIIAPYATVEAPLTIDCRD
jgi:hypothetical protein